MNEQSQLDAITARYNQLAGESCCLSCGGAADLTQAGPGETCLDLGSGRGTDALRLADRVGADGFVWGIDASPAMIQKAAATALRLGVTNVSFLQSELSRIPVPSASVDCVISNCTINHAPDKQAVWNEIFRVLKPGGRFVVSDIYALSPVPDAYASDPARVAECWAGANTKDRYLKTIQTAGFTQVTLLEESAPYSKGEIEVASVTLSGSKPGGGSRCYA